MRTAQVFALFITTRFIARPRNQHVFFLNPTCIGRYYYLLLYGNQPVLRIIIILFIIVLVTNLYLATAIHINSDPSFGSLPSPIGAMPTAQPLTHRSYADGPTANPSELCRRPILEPVAYQRCGITQILITAYETARHKMAVIRRPFIYPVRYKPACP